MIRTSGQTMQCMALGQTIFDGQIMEIRFFRRAGKVSAMAGSLSSRRIRV
jgi:hypothetical protein